ncbi:uncharacterized protein ISCGN_013591 [Ixodes scapularis]
MAATEKMKRIGQLTIKGRKCLVLDPNAKDIRERLLWLPTYLEDKRVVEALEPYGKVRNIVREKWRVPGMEHLETMNTEVSMMLHDAVSSSVISLYFIQLVAQVTSVYEGRDTKPDWVPLFNKLLQMKEL